MIKPFLHEVTLKKIRIFGYSGWKEELLKDIDADQLPQHWGGSRVDPDGDPKCPSVVSLCMDGTRCSNHESFVYGDLQYIFSTPLAQRTVDVVMTDTVICPPNLLTTN